MLTFKILKKDNPNFSQIQGGIYTIIINDKNGCEDDVRWTVSVLEFPKFFTPNGDGKNDTWNIKGTNSSFYTSSEIYIFNIIW